MSCSVSIVHPQGVRLRIYSDHVEIWVPQTVKPSWWEFWRKPTTQMQPVASAPLDLGSIKAGDLVNLSNVGSTYIATVNEQEIFRWPRGSA